MEDRKILFPLLLFAIFFVLIAITGFFQIAIIKKNVEGLLVGGGETLFQSIAREIEINMEYLLLIEKSPSIITPNFLNVMTYDEAIVDDLYSQVGRAKGADPLPALQNVLVVERNGKQILRKGVIRVGERELNLLRKKDRQSIVRMPSDTHLGLFVGIELPDRFVFFDLSPKELDDLRKMYIMRTIVENEKKRLNIAEINIYDGNDRLYLGSGNKPKNVYAIRKPLDSHYLKNYSMEILIWNKLAADTIRRTSTNFIMLLFFLMLGGAGGIYIIFRLDRKNEQRLSAMEKDMARQDRLVSLGRLASGMAHEIRNPLNAIGISIQRLKREFVPEVGKREEYNEFLGIVRSELFRVNRIVEDFLLSTKADVRMEPQSLRSLIEGVVTVLREKAERAGVSLVDDVDEKLKIDCQKERMTQVFYNIIVNAVEAMTGGGEISISASPDGPRTRVFIRDTGPGIKKDDISKIFEYYYTTKDKGMGLGLPLSYMIVKDHGGDIQVLSEEGKGTTFVVALPARKGS
jgi:signal transduction histidine kinase